MPTPPEVKENLPKAELVIKQFDIGNKGSIWENGVGTVTEFLKIGEALNLAITVSESQTAFDNFRKSVGYYGVDGKTLNGFHMKDMFGKSKSVIGVKNAKEGKKGYRTPLEVLMTLAHEISHGIESESKELKPLIRNLVSAHPDSNVRKQTHTGTFRETLNNKIKRDDGKVIRDEIDNLQNFVKVFFQSNPLLGSRNIRASRERSFYEMLRRDNIALTDTKKSEMLEKYKKTLPARSKAHFAYVKDAAEFAVDPIWVYMANPKLMKEVAPETVKLIQQFFKDMPKDYPVSFHANPVAVILAIVMAGVAVREREEEEANQPVNQGSGVLNV